MTEFVIAGAMVFDGETCLGDLDVHVTGEVITAVGGSRPRGVEVIHGSGATLLPLRAEAAQCRDMADVRTPSFALTRPDGHPHQLREDLNDPDWPTATTAEQAAAGVDGLTHVFFDTCHSSEIIERIAGSGTFVVPTLSVLASITDQSAARDLAHDPRVEAKLPSGWLDNLSQTVHTMPEQNFAVALSTVAALHRAGVDVLAGTDAAALGVQGTRLAPEPAGARS